MGKVQFGLSDVHYAIYDEEKKTFGDVKAIPGAVNLSLDVEGDTNKFYADNGAFAVFDTNSGYKGELEIAMIPEDVYTSILGFIKNNAGEIIETSSSKEVHFGFTFRIETNFQKCIAFRYFNCTMSRPSMSYSTTNESTDPTTEKLTINFMPIALEDGTVVTKSHKECTVAEAHTFCSAIALPTITASV